MPEDPTAMSDMQGQDAQQASAPPPSLDVAYGKLREARGRMDVIKNVLGKLVSMGDMVTQEDVIKSASKIVAAGVEPKGIAAMLADMPEKGELIAPWLAQHQEEIAQKEQQLDSVMGEVQHHMGTEAMRQLMGQQDAPQQGASPSPDMGPLGLASSAGGSAPSNPLAME